MKITNVILGCYNVDIFVNTDKFLTDQLTTWTYHFSNFLPDNADKLLKKSQSRIKKKIKQNQKVPNRSK